MLQAAKVSTVLKTIMIIIVLGTVTLAGWAVWKYLIKGSRVDSYKSCVNAGNPIRTSYPSVCVTKDGKQFVNPDQRLN